MKAAIMQPYFMPYIGYFQLINAVDKFVIYDNIQFTRKGWIQRNRMLQNGKGEYFGLSLKKDSDYLNVIDRMLSDTADEELVKLKRKIEGNYRKSPCFTEVFPLIEKILDNPERNLYKFIYQSILLIKQRLGIDTEIIISSELKIDHSLKSQDKVLAICRELNCTNYINPIGGVDLYNRDEFMNRGIDLNFLKSKNIEYTQLGSEFVPWLSIIDILMFNSKEKVQNFLKSFTLL